MTVAQASGEIRAQYKLVEPPGGEHGYSYVIMARFQFSTPPGSEPSEWGSWATLWRFQEHEAALAHMAKIEEYQTKEKNDDVA